MSVAVAANFLGTQEALAAGFTAESGVPVTTSSGSTGQLYAQIENGAPFHVFLSADQERPRWLEEVFMPDRVDSYVKLKARTRIPLAGAEHEYTRWGFKRFLDRDALDVLQPDIYWCGGLSETLKIAACATA